MIIGSRIVVGYSGGGCYAECHMDIGCMDSEGHMYRMFVDY